MSWLNSVRNALAFGSKSTTTPDNLWHKCKGCEQMVFSREWAENQYVCPKCDHHDRIGPGRAVQGAVRRGQLGRDRDT